MAEAPMKAKLLFLCTGNYYRSRFAELLFNHLAAQTGAAWLAESRGLVVTADSGNIGPISPYVLAELAARAVEIGPELRFPRQLHHHDLAGARRIIALDAAEHRPLVEKLFPNWAGRVDYWRVPDLHALAVRDAFDRIDREVRALLQTLK
jgi:protein-tyrosine phosphatase